MIVAFIGGPGTGKTTLANEVTAELKKRGVSAQFVGEYIRNYVEKHKSFPRHVSDQHVVLRGQTKREDEAASSAGCVVTDSAAWLSGVYATALIGENDRSDFVTAFDLMEDTILDFNRYSVVFLMPRKFKFDTRTRSQSNEDEAIRIDEKIRAFITLFNIDVVELDEPEHWVEHSICKILEIIEQAEVGK